MRSPQRHPSMFNLTWCMSYHYLTNKHKKRKSSSRTQKTPNNLQTKKPPFRSEQLTRQKKKSCNWTFLKIQLQLWDWNLPKLPLYPNFYLLVFVGVFPLTTNWTIIIMPERLFHGISVPTTYRKKMDNIINNLKKIRSDPNSWFCHNSEIV